MVPNLDMYYQNMIVTRTRNGSVHFCSTFRGKKRGEMFQITEHLVVNFTAPIIISSKVLIYFYNNRIIHRKTDVSHMWRRLQL